MIQISDHVYADRPLAADEGLQFGRGVFETILVLRRPLFWQAHCRRLNQGLADLAIRLPVESPEHAAAAKGEHPAVDPDMLLAQVEHLGIRSCVLKVLVTAENLVLMTRPIPAAGPDPVQRLTMRPDSRGTDARLLHNKTLSYLPSLLAWQDARTCGFDDVLFYDSEGMIHSRRSSMIRECSRSNIYFIRGSRILTPDDCCGLLPGVVRQWLLDDGQVSPGCFTPADILAADCVFVSNSVVGIRRVCEIDGHPFGDHPLLQKIISRYQTLIIEPAQRP